MSNDRCNHTVKSIGLILALSITVLFISSCASPVSTRSVPIAVAAYPDAEQQMLAALTISLLRANGYSVIDRTDLKSEWHVRQALEAGSVHIAWQNSSVVWFTYLGHDKPVSSESSLFREIKAEDYTHDIAWLTPVSWSTRQSVVMRSDRAADMGISTISGLAQQISGTNPGVTICLPESMINSTRGLSGLLRVYGFRLRSENIRPMELDDALTAVLNGACDCTIGSVKDLALNADALMLLRDNLAFFPASILAPTVHIRTINQYPELERILGQLTDSLDHTTLARLEREVARQRQSYERTATRYLESAGIIE